jgi:hypothetical protein
MPPSPPTKRVRFQFAFIQEDTTRMDCESPRRGPTTSSPTRTIQLDLFDSCALVVPPSPGSLLPLKRRMRPNDNDDDDRQPCWNSPPALKKKKSAFTMPMLLVPPPPPSRRTNYQQEQRAIMESWPTTSKMKRTALMDIEKCITNGTTINTTINIQPPRKKPRLLLQHSTLDKKHWNLQGIISRMMS